MASESTSSPTTEGVPPQVEMDASVSVVPNVDSVPVALKKMTRQMLRSALYAALARLAFGLVKSVLKGGLSKKFVQLALREFLSLNPLKWGCLVGSMSSYRGVQQLLSVMIHPKAAALIAGATTSAGFFAMNVETRTELALYTAVRAAHGVCTGNLWPILPKALQDFQHWDVATMCVSAMQIFYSLFFQPSTHSPSYQAFLMNCTMQDVRTFPSTAAFHRGQVVPEMISYCKSHKLPLPTTGNVPLTDLCQYYHPGTTCPFNVINFIRRHFFGFSMKLYLPLKIVTTAIFGRKQAVKDPKKTVKKIVSQSISSSLFLTLYCAGPWGLVCCFNRANVRNPFMIATLGGFLAGLPTLLEPKSRRMDLALYCMLHSVRAFVLTLYRFGGIARPNRHYLTVTSALAMAAVFYQYDYQRDALHRNLVSVVSWLLSEKQKKVAAAAAAANAEVDGVATPASPTTPTPSGAAAVESAIEVAVEGTA